MEISKENYLILSNTVNDLICIINLNLEIEFVNEKNYVKLLGYSNEDLIGKNINHFIDIKEINKIQEILKKIDYTDEKIVDIQYNHKDGNKIWLEVKIKLLEDKKRGKRVLLISKDISEKKLTELTLKDSEEKYQSIIKNIKEGYYEVDLKGNFTYVNNALCKFIGYSKDELLKENYIIVTDKKTRDLVFKTFNKVFKTEIQQNIFQFPVIRKNGERAFFETSVYLKYNSKGRKIGFYGIVRDITERKKEEDLEEKFRIELAQKVRLRTKEVEESQEKYSNLFQHSNDGIFLHDLEGNIRDVNQKVLDHFGYTKAEILSLNIAQLHPISELVESKKAFEEVSKKGFVRFEINIKKKNGEIFPVEVSSSLFTIGGRKFIQGIVRDITDRKKADLLVQEEIQKLKELDQIRKDLISRVSHELKTPLVSVCGASELLLDLFKDEINEESKELIQMIEKGGSRLKYLVDNLLDITRIEYDKFELIKELTNLSEIIQDCAYEMMYLIKRRKLDLKLELPNELLINLDKIRIEHVVLNLLSNAIKNTPPNGNILIKLYSKGNCAEFFVNDTGIGLTREEMDRIFTRFGKIERYGEGLEFIDIQGSGLGLYISKEIIDLHKGQIWAESAGRDKGSTFIIKLPFS